MDRHRVEHNKVEVKPELKLFKCQLCRFTSKTRFALKNDITASHQKGTTIKCNFCSFETESKRGFYVHSRRVHGRSKCTRCGKHVPSQMTQEHLQVCKTRNPDFACRICNYKTTSRRKFFWHQTRKCNNSKVQKSNDNSKDSEVKKVPKLKVFKCELCPFTSKIRFGLKNHIATSNCGSAKTASDALKCNVCNFEAKSKHGIYLHALFAHETTKCPRCQKRLPVQMKNEHDCRKITRYFECNACSYKTVARKQLSWHKSRKCKKLRPKEASSPSLVKSNNETEQIPKLTVFKCRLCPFSSKIRFALKKHMTSHSSNSETKPAAANTFKCSECSYEVVSKIAFYGHLMGAHKSSAKVCSSCYKLVPQQMRDRHLQICKKTKGNLQICKKTKGKKLKCRYCSFTTHAEQNMQAHTSRHSEDKSILSKCNKCDYKSSQLNVFKHIRSVHNSTIFKCKFCSYSTYTECHLARHAPIHTVSKEPITKCDKCDYRSTRLNVSLHVSNVHGKPSDDDQKSTTCDENVSKEVVQDATLRCKFCSFVARNNCGLVGHLRWHTVLKRPIVNCDRCDYKSPLNNMKQHRRIVHGQSSIGRKDKRKIHGIQVKDIRGRDKVLLKCTFCSFTTKLKKSYNNHAKLHVVRNDPIYSCDECDYKSTKLNLAKHACEKHNKKFDFTQQQQQRKTYICNACPFTETDEDVFNKHIENNHTKPKATKPEELYACKYCSYKTKALPYLKSHIKLHIKNKATIYSCPECNYKGIQNNLAKHLKAAHGVDKTKFEIFKCEFCSFTAQNIGSLTKHTELHTVHKKPIYQCNKCDYKSTARNIANHIRFGHEEPAKRKIFIPPTDSVKKVAPKSPSGSDSIQIVQTLISKSDWNKSPPKNLVFVCEICDYITNTKDALLTHKSTHVKTPKVEATTSKDSKSNFYCKQCNKHFTNILEHRCPTNTDHYTVHVRDGKILFRCRICYFESNVKLSMTKHCGRHMQNHKNNLHALEKTERDALSSETATYKCDICDFQTNLEDSLHNHQVVHININEVKVYKNKTYKYRYDENGQQSAKKERN